MLFHFDENIRTCHIVLGIIDEKIIAALLRHVIRRQFRLRNIVLRLVEYYGSNVAAVDYMICVADLPNKREILESIIDEQDDFWIIMKPSRNNPTDPDYLCVLQNPAEYKEARVEIPTAWFMDEQFDKIQSAVRDAIESAEIGYKYT